MLNYLDSYHHIPKTAQWLGLGGVAPFVFFDLYILFGPEPWVPDVIRAMVGYGAIILSFLGGVLWGLAITHEKNEVHSELSTLLVISMLPPLVGWFALLAEPELGLTTLLLAFMSLWAIDWRFYQAGHSLDWYLILRSILTGLVLFCLLLAWVVT